MSQPISQSNHVASDNATDVGRMQFVIRAALAGLRTAVPVKVISVTNSGGVSAIGSVAVQPLVSLVDGTGTVWPHGTIYNVPYMRIQGGANAVIIDPQVGDIGIATVCDRDISGVKASRAASAPGSTRKNDLSDMVYLMTIIGAAPAQYVQFNASGITVTSPVEVTINAPTVAINGAATITGNLSVTGTIAATGNVSGNGHSLSSHYHVLAGVQSGSSNINTGTTVS